MSIFPHTRLFIGQTRSVVVSGPHIQVLQTQTGEVLRSTDGPDVAAKGAVLRSGPVRCVDVNADLTHLVTSGEDKQLKVWDLENLELLSERELPKKPTDVHLTRDGQTILVSDKFGDIFSYPICSETDTVSAAPAADTETALRRSQILSHENPSGGSLVLGHTSLLTSFLLTDDEKYIVSADRDEHIRVSCYPRGYVIERFCLGHRKFVHAVHIPKFAPSVLVSGGGDPVLKIWDWMSGECLCDIPVGETVEPFIKVRAPKGKWGRSEGNEDDGERKGGRQGKRRGKKGKGKGKGKAELGGDEEDEDQGVDVVVAEDLEDAGNDGEDVMMKDVNAPVGLTTSVGDEDTARLLEETVVLVIHRIASVDMPEQGQFLVFNAVGATALFYCRFPADLSSPPPHVQYLDLGKPVIDFTIDHEGRVWTLVDGERAGTSNREDESSHRLTRLLGWSEGKLVEVAAQEAPPLLSSLNSSCGMSASPEELKALDLYSALSAMPKHVDPEHDPFEGPGADEESHTRADTPQTEQKLGKRKAKELTQREQARLKKKQAVQAKLQEQGQAGSIAASEKSEHESKKAKPTAGEASAEAD